MHMTLDDIRKLCEAATPGPWRLINYYFAKWDERAGQWQGAEIYAGCPVKEGAWEKDSKQRICDNFDYEQGGVSSTEADAKFIAAARTLLPALLNVAEKARATCPPKCPTDCPAPCFDCSKEEWELSKAISALEALRLP